jgi:RHS repeat-associated protein
MNGRQQWPKNLRGRVACVRYSPADNATFEQMTHYSYDVHGNVKTLIQDHSVFGQKRMDYTYDLISGNVKAFFFQKGKWDQYVHYYKYDKDNRLKKVETAQFPTAYSEMRDLDAEYFYYLHGPLARVELGDLKVQGVDYAYTIDGWLKGVNSGTLADVTSDIGKDGSFVAGNFNKSLPRDAFGFVLGYYNNDYTKIGASATNFDNTNAQIMFPTYGVQLFNGNIPQMVTSTRVPDSIGYRGQLCSYKYDQLHRLKSQSSTLMNGVMTAWPAPSVADNHYWMDLTYDYAGNIKTLNRQGLNPTATRPMDQLQYKYTDAAKPNKLTYVDDLQTDAARYSDDIDDQNPANYTYDNIGNMTSDASEGNKTIVWNVYNKITQVNITTPAVAMTFGYDAMGNRVRKTVTKSSITTDQWYLRDAQGNTLAVYKKVGAANIQQDVVYLYGSSRLGELVVQRAAPKIWDNRYARLKGNRHYELTNHLGNVLSVVTDRRLAKEPTASNAPTYYLPDVYMVENYYAFGQPLPKWNSKTTDAPFYDPTKYRYGFNGKEDDDEWSKQDYGFRIYDGRIGRFLSVDPLTGSYPELTSYQFASNIPICGIDLDGLEFYFSVEGAYLGQGPNIKDKSMYLAKEYFGLKDPKTGKKLIGAVDVKGEWSNNLTKLYDNPNQAALEWSFENAVQSRSERVEFASRIGSKSTLDQNGNQITLFLNGTVVKATRDNRNLVDVSTSILPSGWDGKNVVHSHLSGGKAEEFSEGVAGYPCEGDKGCAIACEYDIFLATPKGMLLKFSYKTETVEALYYNLPAGDQYSNPINPAYIKDKKGDFVKNTKFTIPNLQHE